jgi:serine/threonine protein kinase
MPPELLGEGILSKATDAWSFSVLLLEMWHGKRAWLGVQPISVMSQVSAGQLPFDVPSDAPPALANIMRRCISLNPSARPTFQEILAALYELGSSLQSSTPTEGPASAAGSASVTPVDSRGSGRGSKGSSWRVAAAWGAASPCSPFATASPLTSPPTSAPTSATLSAFNGTALSSATEAGTPAVEAEAAPAAMPAADPQPTAVAASVPLPQRAAQPVSPFASS